MKNEKDKKEPIEIQDEADTFEDVEIHPGTHQICGLPNVKGQLGDNIVDKFDYATLTRPLCISDSIINYWLQLLENKESLYNAEGQKAFLVLNTNFYVRLNLWNKNTPGEYIEQLKWDGFELLWLNGARYVTSLT